MKVDNSLSFCSCLFQAQCTNTQSYFGHTNLFNTYYQWVSVYFLLQALVFYVPRCIWLSLEGGLMNFLVSGHQGGAIDFLVGKITFKYL